MTRTLFLAFFIGNVMITQAQLTPAENQANLQALNSRGGVFRTFDNRYTGVKGGVMLTENFVPGKLVTAQGQVYTLEKMNYDAFNDEVVVVHNNQEMAVSNVIVGDFVLGSGVDTLHFKRMLRPDGKIGFSQILISQGNVLLYKRHYKTLKEPDYKGAYSSGRDYSEFIPEKTYFVQRKDQRPVEFKTKKSFLQLFPENEESLESFIKKEKIDFKQDEDLIRLVNYLNEIKD